MSELGWPPGAQGQGWGSLHPSVGPWADQPGGWGQLWAHPFAMKGQARGTRHTGLPFSWLQCTSPASEGWTRPHGALQTVKSDDSGDKGLCQACPLGKALPCRGEAEGSAHPQEAAGAVGNSPWPVQELPALTVSPVPEPLLCPRSSTDSTWPWGLASSVCPLQQKALLCAQPLTSPWAEPGWEHTLRKSDCPHPPRGMHSALLYDRMFQRACFTVSTIRRELQEHQGHAAGARSRGMSNELTPGLALCRPLSTSGGAAGPDSGRPPSPEA